MVPPIELTAEDFEKVGRMIVRQNQVVPVFVVDYMVKASIEKLEREKKSPADGWRG